MKGIPDDLQLWLQQQLDNAVRHLINVRAFEDALIEVKPAWLLPSRLLVGKAREQGNPRAFRWFICGEVPIDHASGEVATSPRELIRHFSLKWQVDASQLDDDAARILIDHAEALYTLTEDARYWQ